MPPLEVKAILDKHPGLKLNIERQKVICTFTNHEMPLTAKAIETHINGKKYKKAAEMAAFNFDKHKAHIVPSNKKKHTHEMFCRLTLRHIEKTPQAIQRHITGRKYMNALSRWLKCQETGEKFVPHVRRKGKLQRSYKASQGNSSLSFDSDENQSNHGSDDMSDLYPEEDFDDGEDEEEEEEDDDDNDDDDEQEEEDSEEENEEPVQLQKTKKANKPIQRKKKEKTHQGTEEQEDSESDYDIAVLDSVDKAANSSSISEPHKKSDHNALPTTKTDTAKAKVKRKNENNDSHVEMRGKEKKKKKKKKEKAVN